MDCINRSVEPMDVDISNSSLNVSNISDRNDGMSCHLLENKDFKSNEERCVKNIVTYLAPFDKTKKVHVNIQPHNKKERKSNRGKNITNYFIICVLIPFISYCIFNQLKVQCIDKLNTEILQKPLLDKVYGQQLPIKTLIEVLNVKRNHKVILMYGSTGVGKTYTVNLLLNELWNYSNVYHYVMPSFKFVYLNSLMTGLIMCPASIVVIDDLTIQDLTVKSYINEILDKSKKLENDITMFLIFNCAIDKNFSNKCDDIYFKKLQELFSDINSDMYYIKFNDLSEKELINCITNELNMLNFSYNIDMNDFLMNFNVSLDGCKTVYSKVRTLLKQFKHT